MTARPRRATHAWFESGGAQGRKTPGAQRQRNEAETPAGERQPADPHLRRVQGAHDELQDAESAVQAGTWSRHAGRNSKCPHDVWVVAGAPESKILLKGASAGSCGRPAVVSSASMRKPVSVKDITSWKPTAKELTAKVESSSLQPCVKSGALATAVLP